MSPYSFSSPNPHAKRTITITGVPLHLHFDEGEIPYEDFCESISEGIEHLHKNQVLAQMQRQLTRRNDQTVLGEYVQICTLEILGAVLSRAVK